MGQGLPPDEDGCVETNNNGMIDTSSGPKDVLAWGSDECVMWSVDLPGMGSSGPRPVSWTIGEQNPFTCEYERGDVWVGWYDNGGNTGHFRLQGNTYAAGCGTPNIYRFHKETETWTTIAL